MARDETHVGCGGQIKKREAVRGRYFCEACSTEFVCLKEQLGDIYECFGYGYLEVPDNGTNFGEEECDYCNGEGKIWADEFGDRRED